MIYVITHVSDPKGLAKLLRLMSSDVALQGHTVAVDLESSPWPVLSHHRSSDTQVIYMKRVTAAIAAKTHKS